MPGPVTVFRVIMFRVAQVEPDKLQLSEILITEPEALSQLDKTLRSLTPGPTGVTEPEDARPAIVSRSRIVTAAAAVPLP
jgi:hypothetical protein